MKYVQTTTGDWQDLKGKLREEYKALSIEDLEFEDGQYEDMISAICVKLNKTRQELIWILNSFTRNQKAERLKEKA